jgi:hypothetical protein
MASTTSATGLDGPKVTGLPPALESPRLSTNSPTGGSPRPIPPGIANSSTGGNPRPTLPVITNFNSSLNSSDSHPSTEPFVGAKEKLEKNKTSDISSTTTSNSNTPIYRSRSSGKLLPTPTPESPEREPSISFASSAVGMKMERIFQRFLVRCPHTFIAMGVTFVSLYYGMSKESMAYSAATFVGMGGTVYCLVRAIFLETIPEWMLPRNDETRKWRHLINVSYTSFLTVMFTSAVWKLPDLSATQGLIFLAASFGLPYPFLYKFYGDIDKQPTWMQQRYDM